MEIDDTQIEELTLDSEDIGKLFMQRKEESSARKEKLMKMMNRLNRNQNGVTMANGTMKNIEDIVVGDKVLGEDGCGHEVEKCEIVAGNVYRITPARGREYDLPESGSILVRVTPQKQLIEDKGRKRYKVRYAANHKVVDRAFAASTNGGTMQTAKEAAEYFIKNEMEKQPGYEKAKSIVQINVADFYKLSKASKDMYKIFSAPIIDFPAVEVDIDPYILGYWLGDGTSADTSFTTKDPEVVDELKKYATSLDLKLVKIQSAELRYNITTGTNFGGPGRNTFRNMLNSNNLLNNKHIPIKYKFNSKEVRLKVLAGLMDSDGYCGPDYDDEEDKDPKKDRNVYDVSFKSKTLSDDTVFLVRSLGFFTTLKIEKKTCTNSSNGRVTNYYYRFCVSGEGLEEIPVLLKRKKAHERKSKKNPRVNGLDIQKIDNVIYRKITIKDNVRYMADDFTVIC